MHPRLRYLSLATTALLLSLTFPLFLLTSHLAPLGSQKLFDQDRKAEALSQAQITLITGDYKALGEQGGFEVQQRINTSLSTSVNQRLNYPITEHPSF